MGTTQSIPHSSSSPTSTSTSSSSSSPTSPTSHPLLPNPSISKLLQQEPEILTCHASASPLSPQLSSIGTPRLLANPSIKVWDPCHVLGPPPVSDLLIFLVAVAEGTDVVSGRWTANADRRVRALSVFLNSESVRFDAVFCSPLDRARAAAKLVCRELEFAEEHIQFSDALTEMSNGQWEGLPRSEVYTPEMTSLMEKMQPDFCAPSGESLRQVEFRMIEFLNRTVLKMPGKLSAANMLMHQNERKDFSRHSSMDSVHEPNGPAVPQWDLLQRHNKQVLTRKKSGKSRLQFVRTTGDHEIEDEASPRETDHLHEVNARNTSSIGIFTHATPISCLLTGILGCSPAMSTKLCIEDSSVTVLAHSLQTGWQIKRMNDTSHLRLL